MAKMGRPKLVLPETISKYEAEKYLKEEFAKGEENLDGAKINLIMDNHPSLYLKYLTIRDLNKRR